MKILKRTGPYLMSKARLNRNISIVFFVIGIFGSIYTYFTLKATAVFISVFAMGIGGFFYKKYDNYNRGLKGEKLVEESLRSLPDSYYLICDVTLPGSHGNLDHIILGPNGIFAIETKSFTGNIRCDGDRWYQYKESWKIPMEREIKSLSKQVKGNAFRLKRFIDSMNVLSESQGLWVNGIIVFTHSDVNLDLNAPTVPVLRLDKLCNHIEHIKSNAVLHSRDLQILGTILANRSSV